MNKLLSLIYMNGLTKINSRTYNYVKGEFGSVVNPEKFVLKFKKSNIPHIFIHTLKKDQVNILQQLHNCLKICSINNYSQVADASDILKVFCFYYDMNIEDFKQTYNPSKNKVLLFPFLDRIIYGNNFLTVIEKIIFEQGLGYHSDFVAKKLTLLSKESGYSRSALFVNRKKLNEKLDQLFLLSNMLSPFINYSLLFKREGDFHILQTDSIKSLNRRHSLKFSLSFYLEFFSAFLPGEYQQIIFKLEHNSIYALIPLHLKDEFINSLEQQHNIPPQPDN